MGRHSLTNDFPWGSFHLNDEPSESQTYLTFPEKLKANVAAE